jgi:hypothetical protein
MAVKALLFSLNYSVPKHENKRYRLIWETSLYCICSKIPKCHQTGLMMHGFFIFHFYNIDDKMTRKL